MTTTASNRSASASVSPSASTSASQLSLRNYLSHYGWTIESLTPYEIRHDATGSVATGRAAEIVQDDCESEAVFDGVTLRVAG